MDITPKEGATIISVIYAGLGSIIGAVLGVFTAGRMAQKEITRIDNLEKAVAGVEKSVTDIKRLFVTEEGDPRLISILMCDSTQRKCQSLRDERYDALVKTVEKQGALMEKQWEKIDKIYDHIINRKS